MKHSKLAVIIVTVMNIVLIIICGIFYLGTDRMKPEFKFQLSELIYTREVGTEKLLGSITALDNKDGDVTGRIVIEKVIENNSESSVIVFYAVSDKAGNVAKISRVFSADLTEKEIVEEKFTEVSADNRKAETDSGTPADSTKNGGTENNTETGIEDNAEADVEYSRETGVEDGAEDNTENSSAEDSAEDNPENSREDDTEDNTEIGEADSTEQNPAGASGGTDNQNERISKEEIPVITLKASEVTTTKGAAPAWVEIIGSLTDDKDTYETLFYNLNVSKYDVNKAGSYKVTLTTKDSSGNVSEAAALTIHVK